MTNAIIGIDPSSRKLACVVTVRAGTIETVEKWVLLMPPKKQDISCNMAYNYVEKLIRRYQDQGHDVFVFVEMAVGARGGGVGSMVPQVEVVGAVLAVCGKYAVPITKVQNGKWKKEIVGKGNATKPQIKAWAKQYWRNLYTLANGDQDVIDAGAINRWGDKHVGSVPLVKKRPRKISPTTTPRKIIRKAK